MDAALALRPTFADLKAGLDVRAGGRIVAAAADAFSTGFAGLDRALGGGFPRGTLATLEGGASSGRTAILAGALAQATRLGLAAIVDDGSLYPPDLERAGVQLARTLIVMAQTPVETARCADILLRSRAFAIVAMPAVPLRATVWSRLCGLAQKSGAVLFALAMNASNELAYFASTRVRCAIDRVVWSGSGGVLCELAGYEVNAHVVKHRRAAPGAVARLRIVDERSMPDVVNQ
jgi:RecA/RadA recombinase